MPPCTSRCDGGTTMPICILGLIFIFVTLAQAALHLWWLKKVTTHDFPQCTVLLEATPPPQLIFSMSPPAGWLLSKNPCTSHNKTSRSASEASRHHLVPYIAHPPPPTPSGLIVLSFLPSIMFCHHLQLDTTLHLKIRIMQTYLLTWFIFIFCHVGRRCSALCDTSKEVAPQNFLWCTILPEVTPPPHVDCSTFGTLPPTGWLFSKHPCTLYHKTPASNNNVSGCHLAPHCTSMCHHTFQMQG